MQTAIDQAVQLLSTSADHRVLRRVPPVEQWQFADPESDVVRAVVVDCETTGLADTDEVIELGIVPFDYCKTTGRVTAVHTRQMLSAFRQPTCPISEEVQQLTGITPEMVAGQAITEDQLSASMFGTQLVIAFNSKFDRPKLESHWLSTFGPLCWGCAFAEIDWRGEGLRSSKLDYLLYAMGWFHDGHRALDDCLALLWLLSLPLPKSGKQALSVLLEQARKPLYLVRAENTPIPKKEVLKARGYRFEPESDLKSKAWVIATNEPRAELEWLKQCPAWTPRAWAEVVRVPHRLRFSNRVYAQKGAA